jgi:penicillin G amidase
MKVLKIILYTILTVVVVAIIGGLIFLNGMKKSALPKYNGEIVLTGLSGDVTVYRDERGMPHIYASNEHDLYFAVGYVMAQERLWQMDLLRRATKGTLSEVMGEVVLESDMLFRAVNMSAKSKVLVKNTDPVTRSYLQAFSDGINSYVSAAGKNLPPEFKILSCVPDPWTPEDCGNIFGYMCWDAAYGDMDQELSYRNLVGKIGLEKTVSLIPDFDAVKAFIFPDFKLSDTLINKARKFIEGIDKLEALGIVLYPGSNNWVVSGKRSETGMPILENDMHLSLFAPGIWMQMHQVIPGKLNVTGVTVPGVPFIAAGHNDRIAWGFTYMMADVLDLFAEKINPENENQYSRNGIWNDMVLRKELFKIKGGRVDSMVFRYTHRGPIISGLKSIKNASLSMRWTAFDNSEELAVFSNLNRAGGWNDFRSALSSLRSLGLNVAYADIDGNIGLNIAAGIPIRKGNGSLIRNGETDEYDWKGYIPFEQLPSRFNPEKGYVSSANQRTVPEGYPYYISSDFCMPYRINRIRQMLDEKEIMGIEDFKRMVLDQHSDYAALVVPFILKQEMGKARFSQAENSAFNSLVAWDFDMDKDLIAPTIFEYFIRSFKSNLLNDELGDLSGELPGIAKDYYVYRILKTGPDEFVNDVTTSQKETLDEIILKSYKDCIASLSMNYGEDQKNWKWGDIHKITIEHPLGTVQLLNHLFGLNSKTFRVGGSNHTVSPYSYSNGFKVNHGASERHIFNTANWDESLTIIPTGNSGIPASEFYLSQTDSYINGKFYKDAFTEPAVKAATKYTLVLKAGK